MVCTELGGKICKGAYGVTVIHEAADGSTLGNDSICSVNERVRGDISGEEGSAAHIELWYTSPKVFYRATCYFWCTDDGEMGEGEVVDTDLVEKVLSGTWHTLNVTRPVVPISPVAHYQIRRQQQSILFEWRGDEEGCKGWFICSDLEGNDLPWQQLL